MTTSTPTASHCNRCNTKLRGAFCHSCGQASKSVPITLSTFLADVRKRVFRLDVAFVQTFWRLIKNPGALLQDYLHGDVKNILDPVQYFITCTFIELIVISTVHVAAPAWDRVSALNWLSRLSSIVAVKIVLALWVGILWRWLVWRARYNLGEIYSFIIYAYGTIGVLWLVPPIIDLVAPISLGTNNMLVAFTLLAIQSIYLIYAARQFERVTWWSAIWRMLLLLIIVYLPPIIALGMNRSFRFVLAPLS